MNEQEALVYEDQRVKALLAPDAAVNGHVLVQAQKNVKRLAELSPAESAHFFLVANYAAAILFQGLQAAGTNIIVNEDDERLTAHVIARRADDQLSFQWTPQNLDESTMNDAMERIKEKTFYVGKQKKGGGAEKKGGEQERTKESNDEKASPPDEKKRPSSPVDDAEETDNYLVKQLIRVP